MDLFQTGPYYTLNHCLKMGLNLVNDYPKIVLSDSIPGLNPGFHILVAGACPVSEPDRVRDLEMAKADWNRAYLRRVRRAESVTKNGRNPGSRPGSGERPSGR